VEEGVGSVANGSIGISMNMLTMAQPEIFNFGKVILKEAPKSKRQAPSLRHYKVYLFVMTYRNTVFCQELKAKALVVCS